MGLGACLSPLGVGPSFGEAVQCLGAEWQLGLPGSPGQPCGLGNRSAELEGQLLLGTQGREEARGAARGQAAVS